MALTQTATIPRWDEEVVPALRKRLENESRTLARRLSGMSLINGDNQYGQAFSSLANAAARDSITQLVRTSEDMYQRRAYQPYTPPSQGPSSSSPVHVAPTHKSKKPTPMRNRTVSQPYTPDAISTKRRLSTSRSPNGSARPTRIPKASRTPASFTPHNSPRPNHLNGFGQYEGKAANGPLPDSLASREHANSSLTTLGELGHQASGLLDEPPPFLTTTMSSTRSHPNVQTDETPPRQSIDSEERPFEHWYRGEVSRNGGVGEFRVGRRQEMLDIANYGHKLAQLQREAAARQNRSATVDDGRWRRKRADSVGEISRPERDSVHLDEEDAQRMVRVLDESPPTDLDGEGDDDSDTHSAGDHYAPSTQQRHDTSTDYQIADLSTASEPLPQLSESRSTTPTPATVNSPSASQHNGHYRVQTLSSSRPSVDSRATTPIEMKRGVSEPPSSSRSPPSTPRAHRQQPKDAITPPSTQKRAVSPGTKAKPPLAKAARTKPVKPKRQMTEEEKRKSVAVYPLSAGDDDMADAIPSWTQPKPKEGNWDEVVLPVVARKKGLEDQYERADGSPQPRKVEKLVEPAPGTFGFRYRDPNHSEDIPMDEFGVPTFSTTEDIPEEILQEPQAPEPEPVSGGLAPVPHDEVRLPVRHGPPPSPVPFADYIPKRTREPIVAQPAQIDLDDRPTQREEDKDGAGCCKCVIM